MRHLFYLSIVLLFTVFVSCSRKNSSNEGWVTLFDGKTFAGWRGYNKAHVPPLWTIEPGGIMKANGTGGNEGSENGGDILFDKKVKNFEFELEWKLPVEGGNSGIIYLAQELPGQPMYLSGPEYQIADNKNTQNLIWTSAALYDMIAPNPQNANPLGQWNKAKIKVYNGKVTHYQNDVEVLSYTLWTKEWENLLNNSKFGQEKWPLAYRYQLNLGGENREGYFGLQDHGTVAYFRNIRMKELLTP